MDLVRDADAVVVQFAPITKRVIDAMERCKLIVRYAIGVDNIDVDAATARGIYVANVPDYGIDEVSNHAVTLLLALSKMLIPRAGCGEGRSLGLYHGQTAFPNAWEDPGIGGIRAHPGDGGGKNAGLRREDALL